MAFRTTPDLVKGVIEVDEDSVSDLTPFIIDANLLVNQVCLESGYEEDHLTRIETWLAAHLYAIRDPRTTQETTGPISDMFQSKVDLGFDVTHYGQQAMRLDTDGNLAALNNSVKVVTVPLPVQNRKKRITWLGTDD